MNESRLSPKISHSNISLLMELFTVVPNADLIKANLTYYISWSYGNTKS